MLPLAIERFIDIKDFTQKVISTCIIDQVIIPIHKRQVVLLTGRFIIIFPSHIYNRSILFGQGWW